MTNHNANTNTNTLGHRSGLSDSVLTPFETSAQFYVGSHGELLLVIDIHDREQHEIIGDARRHASRLSSHPGTTVVLDFALSMVKEVFEGGDVIRVLDEMFQGSFSLRVDQWMAGEPDPWNKSEKSLRPAPTCACASCDIHGGIEF